MNFDRVKLAIIVFCLSCSIVAADSFRIAFGSCYDQHQPSEEIFYAIAKVEPQLLILMGDNIYVDSDQPKKFASDYALLGANKGYAALAAKDMIMAVWDDHDYGSNDGGKEFHGKHVAKQYFVDFFDYEELKNIPVDRGIEHARRIKVADKVVQIILLDTRWYRDKLRHNGLSEAAREEFQLGSYQPHIDTTKTLLGKRQWQWLEKQLSQPADLNIIVSSIQLIAEFTAWETWANFPHERTRMLQLIGKYSPGKTVVISGDVHRSETSKLDMGGWSLYDLTASGLAANMYPAKPNIHRVGDVVVEHNFGLLDIEFKPDGTILNAGYYNEQAKPITEINISNRP